MSQDDTAAADKAARKAARAAKRARKEAKRLASTSAQPQLDEEESATATTNDQTEQERPKKKRKREADDYLSENAITFEPADASFTFPPILAFTDLDVPSSLTAALAAFDKPTPVQAASWPVLLAGRDAIAIAKTGSGKTLAFGLPALRHVLELPKPKHKAKEGKPPPKGAVNVLVVAPTRELAMQIHVTLDGLAAVQEPPLPTVCIYGGVSKAAQVDQLRTGKHGARIVAGTPGRLLDLANDGQLDLSNVSYLVLDEADRMLDAGFEQDVRRIVGMCKPDRQTAMFSATWPMSVRRLANDFMRQDGLVRITVGSDELSANTAITQSVLVLPDGRQKDGKLLDTLRQHGKKDKCLVFALYKKEAARVHTMLRQRGYDAVCIQGDLSQDARTKALEAFRSGQSQLLVATDVACRGLDVPLVELVVNYTFPLTIEDYVHRIGRTGRAGRTGKSITFFTADDKAHAGELQRVLRDAGQEVPDELREYGGTIKKATHSAYGAHFRDDIGGTAKKIKFD